MSFDTNLRVLVVEDSSTMRNIIVNALKDLEFTNITEAEDGNKALMILDSQEIDLVLCDWKMPSCSGIEVLEKVRARPEFKDLPFIMVTAESQKENVMEAIKKGVSNYIIKPFDREKLKKKIEQTLTKK